MKLVLFLRIDPNQITSNKFKVLLINSNLISFIQISRSGARHLIYFICIASVHPSSGHKHNIQALSATPQTQKQAAATTTTTIIIIDGNHGLLLRRRRATWPTDGWAEVCQAKRRSILLFRRCVIVAVIIVQTVFVVEKTSQLQGGQ